MIVGRRIAATLMGLILLQPSAVIADAVCDAHGAAAPESVADAPHSHGAPIASHDGVVAAQESCHDVPPQADCCRLLASCGTEPGVGTVVRASELPEAESLHAGADVTRPMSFLAAPEPPPPRS